MEIDEYRKLDKVEGKMWYFSALYQRIEAPLKQWHGRKAEILDAGCGTGGLIRFLQQREPMWSLTGLDFSSVACSLAREKTHAQIIEGSITNLPFSDESFDILICADVISQVEDPGKALHEFTRVVRRGGMVILNVAAYQWMWSYHDDACHTKQRFRKSQLLHLTKACGLDPQRATYANMFIFPLVIARRKLFPPKSPSSDVMLYSPFLENLCAFFARLEHNFIFSGGSFPAGCSVFIIASKN